MPQIQQTFTIRVGSVNGTERLFKSVVFFRYFPSIQCIVVGKLEENRTNLLGKKYEVVEHIVENVLWYEFNIVEIGN